MEPQLRPCLMVDFYLPFPDNELLYRTREGDVVKLNFDTEERTVIVLKQLFVSIVSLHLFSSLQHSVSLLCHLLRVCVL